MKAKITLSSDLYGEEHFEYDTVKEAKAGLSRLTKSCQKQFAEDNVERQLTLEGANGKVFKDVKIISPTIVEVL